ncbi:glycosyltransferase family 2 protein [Nocardioides hwasunensis]|uniref:Glycosyltransferase n=1 Tax=Nocardioides hwasunensis TaxID=397258 RepID=A0ABR8MF56_9ACTN|nr:glycosyltransferase [Nocardioides hwasunensis]MBD3913109.1 glycosyltransferase [Nocardioides hwasunensis]
MTAEPADRLEIFVPYWGDPSLLRTTIDSVRAQDDDRWTLTVVDDCYPDPSVADSFAREGDPRIRYRRNDENLGIAGNFQRCLDLASGDAVVFLGCDDVLEPSYVARAHALLAAYPSADIFQPGVRVIDADGEASSPLGDRVKRWLTPRTPVPLLLSGEDLAVSLLRGNWLYWPSLMFRTAQVKRQAFRQDLPIILDLALVMDMVTDGSSLLLDPQVTFAYRRHETSLSGTALSDGSRFAQDRRYFADAAAQMRRTGWRRAEREARTRWTSRLHAITLAPDALRSPDDRAGALRQVVRHAFAR